MNHSLITVCPNCKKEVSEFALLCSSCGCSLDKQPPIKVDAASLGKKPKLHTSRATIICMVLSVITGALSLLVLAQALLAFKIVRGIETTNGLVLFRTAVAQLSFSSISIGIFASAAFLVASIVMIISLLVKVIRKQKAQIGF